MLNMNIVTIRRIRYLPFEMKLAFTFVFLLFYLYLFVCFFATATGKRPCRMLQQCLSMLNVYCGLLERFVKHHHLKKKKKDNMKKENCISRPLEPSDFHCVC